LRFNGFKGMSTLSDRAVGFDKVSEWARRVKGAKFLWLDPAWIDELGAIRDIVKKALASAGKGK